MEVRSWLEIDSWARILSNFTKLASCSLKGPKILYSVPLSKRVSNLNINGIHICETTRPSKENRAFKEVQDTSINSTIEIYLLWYREHGETVKKKLSYQMTDSGANKKCLLRNKL